MPPGAWFDLVVPVVVAEDVCEDSEAPWDGLPQGAAEQNCSSKAVLPDTEVEKLPSRPQKVTKKLPT